MEALTSEFFTCMNSYHTDMAKCLVKFAVMRDFTPNHSNKTDVPLSLAQCKRGHNFNDPFRELEIDIFNLGLVGYLMWLTVQLLLSIRAGMLFTPIIESTNSSASLCKDSSDTLTDLCLLKLQSVLCPFILLEN